MSNALYSQTALGYLPPNMFERPPPPTAIVAIEPVKSYSYLQENRISCPLRPVALPSSIPTHTTSYYPPIQAPKRDMDELARLQEDFILRCKYPKRILPGELPVILKKTLYSERRRERSGSPGEGRRKSHRSDVLRGPSKSPSRPWRTHRRPERSQSRSPRRILEFSPPGTRSPAVQTDSNPAHRSK